MWRTDRSACPPDSTASDWSLEINNTSLPSFAFDTSLHQLRADTLIQSKSDMHISMEQLSLTHDSLCETDILPPSTASDVSHVRSSPPKINAWDEKCDLQSHLANENALDRLLDRVQVRSCVFCNYKYVFMTIEVGVCASVVLRSWVT